MKLAFLISAHTDPQHLEALCNSLPAGSEFYIHIDRKSDIRPFQERLSRPNVHFLTHRVNVMWGSINEVEYQMELIRAALTGDADYFISMSGMDYPLWSNPRIIDYFEKAKAQKHEILQGISMLHQGEAARLYTEFRFFSAKPWRYGSLGSKFRVALRKIVAATGVKKTLEIHCPEKTYTLYKGAAWWAITTELGRFVLKAWDENEPLRHYFKTSFCPAETFIQTVAFNSPFRDRCILTTGKFECLEALTPLTYIYYRPVIKILTEEDFPILQSSGKMFCRKVITGKSDRLMKMIDAERNK